MHRFIGSLVAVVFALSVGTSAALAATSTKCPAGETYTKGYTKADGTKVSGYCSSHGSKAAPAAAATTAPKAMATAASNGASSMKSSTTKSMASPAAKAMATSASSTSKTATDTGTCPAGKTYVHGYTKSNGTKVAGYCRSAPSK